MGIFAHSSSTACWTGRPGLFQFIPKVFSGVEVRWVCVGQSRSSTPNSSNHVFAVLALCTGAHHCPKCLSTLQNQDFLSMDVRSLVQPLKNSHQTIPLHPTLQSAQCSQAGDVHLSSVKPRLAHLTAKQRSVIRHSSQNRFPLLQSPVVVCFTPLYLTLGGEMLACSCSAIEIHYIKLPPQFLW